MCLIHGGVDILAGEGLEGGAGGVGGGGHGGAGGVGGEDLLDEIGLDHLRLVGLVELDVTSLETIELRILSGIHTANRAGSNVEITTEGARGRAVDDSTSSDTHKGAVNHVDVIYNLARLREDLSLLVLLGGDGIVVKLGKLGVLGAVGGVVEAGNTRGEVGHGKLVHGNLGSHTGLGGTGGELEALRVLALNGDILLVGIETIARLGGRSERKLLNLTVVERSGQGQRAGSSQCG